MEKNSFKKRVVEAVPGLMALPIVLLGMIGTGCEGEHDLLTTGFNCENPFHEDHLTCGTTTTTPTPTTPLPASSSTASFLSPNQG
jgi:hypothetical protein